MPRDSIQDRFSFSVSIRKSRYKSGFFRKIRGWGPIIRAPGSPLRAYPAV